MVIGGESFDQVDGWKKWITAARVKSNGGD